MKREPHKQDEPTAYMPTASISMASTGPAMTVPEQAVGQARKRAFDIIVRHPDCIRDDVVLNDLIEDIAAALDEPAAQSLVGVEREKQQSAEFERGKLIGKAIGWDAAKRDTSIMLATIPASPKHAGQPVEGWLAAFIARQRAKLETITANAAWKNGYREALKNVESVDAALSPAPASPQPLATVQSGGEAFEIGYNAALAFNVENGSALANLVREVLDNAPGDDAERFILLPHTLAELGWYRRAEAALSAGCASPKHTGQPVEGWQYRGEPLTVNDPDWVAEATEPLTSSFYMTAQGAATMGLTVKTCRGPQRAKFKDWIVRVAGEIYLLTPEAYHALSAAPASPQPREGEKP